MVVAGEDNTPGFDSCAHGHVLRLVFMSLLCLAGGAMLILSPMSRAYLRADLYSFSHTPLLYRNATTTIKQYSVAYFRDLEVRTQRASTVIYNRVPKCGSSATLAIFADLKKQSHYFNFKRSSIYHTEHMDFNQTTHLIRQMNGYEKPWLFERHLHFLNTNNYGMDIPLYINLVRNPIDRFVSEYYFHRFEHRKPMSHMQRNRTFDECVHGNFDECSTETSFVIIPFFCGQESMCLKPSNAALDRAKHNVDKYYGAIGLTEDLLPSYILLENTMPHFFANMSQITEFKLRHLKSKFRTHKKPRPSKAALYIMRTRLALENEFYYYVRHRYVQFLKRYKIHSHLIG